MVERSRIPNQETVPTTPTSFPALLRHSQKFADYPVECPNAFLLSLFPSHHQNTENVKTFALFLGGWGGWGVMRVGERLYLQSGRLPPRYITTYPCLLVGCLTACVICGFEASPTPTPTSWWGPGRSMQCAVRIW